MPFPLVRNEGISNCIFSINPLKKHRINKNPCKNKSAFHQIKKSMNLMGMQIYIYFLPFTFYSNSCLSVFFLQLFSCSISLYLLSFFHFLFSNRFSPALSYYIYLTIFMSIFIFIYPFPCIYLSHSYYCKFFIVKLFS